MMIKQHGGVQGEGGTLANRRNLMAGGRYTGLYYRGLRGFHLSGTERGTVSFRGGKNIPDDHEHGRDQWPEDKTVDAKNSDATQGGDQHNVIRHPDVLADQERTHKVINQAYDEHAIQDEHDAFSNRAGGQEINTDRQPDQSSSDRRQ